MNLQFFIFSIFALSISCGFNTPSPISWISMSFSPFCIRIFAASRTASNPFANPCAPVKTATNFLFFLFLVTLYTNLNHTHLGSLQAFYFGVFFLIPSIIPGESPMHAVAVSYKMDSNQSINFKTIGFVITLIAFGSSGHRSRTSKNKWFKSEYFCKDTRYPSC